MKVDELLQSTTTMKQLEVYKQPNNRKLLKVFFFKKAISKKTKENLIKTVKNNQ